MILIVFKCQNSSLDFFRHSQKVCRKADGAVHYDQVIDECKKRQSDNTGYWSDEMKKDFVNAPHWSIEKWISVLGKRWRTEEKISILLESELSCINSCTFEQSKDIQRSTLINPALQDNVMLP